MRLTTIDIGTNTILMLVADLHPDGRILTIRDEHVIAGLGRGVDENRRISSETIERVLNFLRDFKRISDENASERIIASGTSALRDAANRDDFIAAIAEQLGFTVEVLGGDEEAELTYIGAVTEFLQAEKERSFAVLDIGGGSTELTLGTDDRVRSKQSLDLGCVRLTERFLKSSPPSSLSMNHALNEIRSKIGSYPGLPAATELIGVAGTLTTLAAMDLGLESYDRARVSGHVLTFETIQQIFNHLRIKSVSEILEHPQVLAGRADILLAGILILLEVMKKLNAGRITVSDRGLRFGLVAREHHRATS